MEMWLSGRKRLTANEVGSLNTLMGSNPIISANTFYYLCQSTKCLTKPHKVLNYRLCRVIFFCTFYMGWSHENTECLFGNRDSCADRDDFFQESHDSWE